MLILCVGMYRACSTWQYGVVGELLGRHRDGLRLGFADGGTFAETLAPGLDPARWAVLKAHDADPRFAERLDRGRALGIYSHRDLRDVAFSWMHKTGQDFDGLIREGFLDRCLRNDRFWRDRPGMLFQSYEALIADPARGVEEIAGHLGIPLGEGEAREVAGLLSLDANRRRTFELADRLRAEGIPLSSHDQGKYDRQTLLHWNHIRDGRAGGWKELATPGQEATLNRLCGPWLVEHGYERDLAECIARADRAVEALALAERAGALERLLDSERRRAEAAEAASIEVGRELTGLEARLGEEVEARRRESLARLAEREAISAELRASEADRQALRAALDDLTRHRDALALEVGGLHAERARLGLEIHARDVEIDRARTQLGPYLKIDRLGVITAIQRKVHAHRAHSKGSRGGSARG